MKSYLKIVVSLLIRLLLSPIRLFPIKNDKLVFAGLTGGTSYEYSCNPKYICEHICSQMPGRFRICWLVSRPEDYRDKERKEISFCRHYSLKSFYWLLTARVVVTSGSYAPWFPFRKGQYLINTWHGGGAYKKIENDKPDANRATRQRARFCAKNISLFLSSCEKATSLLFRGAFLYQGEVMEAGMPRNDSLVLGKTKEAEKAVREYYGIGREEKMILYAPTYRTPSREVVLDADRLLAFLEAGGGKWRFLYRAHRYQGADGNITVQGSRILDVSAYPDMQELLGAASLLITDYSSAVWDYSFLFRPCFLYVPDLEEYLEKTGFYVDIHEWPFAMAHTQEELERQIERYDPDAAKIRIEQHHAYMGNKETGHACERAAERILDVCEEKL